MNSDFLSKVVSRRLGRRVVRALQRHLSLPLQVELALNLGARPNYLYCTYHAAVLAKRLGITRISALEFGVAGGNGLVFLDQLAPRIERELGVQVEIFGFDTGGGLPEVSVPEDLPYWFHPVQYKMDVAALQHRLRSAKMILGNVSATVGQFFSRYDPAPVGVILNDLDLYTSTRDSLKLFDVGHAFFLPRVFMYFDDVIGTELEMYSECSGQLLAISEFNRRQSEVYIGLNQNLLQRVDIAYKHQIYYAHIKQHPLYCKYIGGNDQARIESVLQLKSP